MHSKTNKIVLIVTIFILIIACKATLYMPTTIDYANTGISVDSLILGRNLYIDKCGGCHNLRKPEKYTQKAFDLHWGNIELLSHQCNLH